MDLYKHLSCEMCLRGSDIQHFGNYDEKFNQVYFFTTYFVTTKLCIGNIFGMYPIHESFQNYSTNIEVPDSLQK